MEKKLLIATRESKMIAACGQYLGDKYTLDAITAPHEFSQENTYSLAVVDQEFTEYRSLDFLMMLLSHTKIPVIILGNPDDPTTTEEALNIGAYNFLIKTGNYLNLLSFAVADAITKYYDNLSLQKTVLELKNRILHLESHIESNDNSLKEVVADSIETKHSAPAKAPEQSIDQTIFKDIVESLRNGEINLPSSPMISRKFKELLARGADISELSQLLQKDAGVASKMISVANSTFYRGTAVVKTLEQAISRIGISETRNYVELIENRSLYVLNNPRYKKYLDDLWQHSLACAYATQELATFSEKFKPDELFVMGLFHDIGKLVMTQIIVRLESKGAYKDGVSLDNYQSVLEKHHFKFGESLMKRWKMSDECTFVVRYVNDLSSVEKWTNELLIVHFADHLACKLGYGDKQDTVNADAVKKCLGMLSLEEADVAAISKKIENKMQAGMLL